MHSFDEALQLTSKASDGAAQRWQGQTHAGYQNMVGPYGGLTAALIVSAVQRHPQCLGEPVSLTVNFAAAVTQGAFEIEARPVRTNRSTQHWVVLTTQTDPQGVESVVTTATLITAKRRTTWSSTDLAMPVVPRPQELSANTMFGTEWFRRYDMRLVSGGIPTELNGAEGSSLTQLWVRDAPDRALDHCSLTAMSDVFFPRVWRKRALLVPAGTVSMTVYLHASAAELAATGTGFLFAQARGQRFFNGYFDQTAQLWNEAGELLSTTHQVVYFKE